MARDRQSHWTVIADADDARVQAVLETDRIWNAFSLADLEPPFRGYSRFHLAVRGGAPATAVCLVLRYPAFTNLIPHGDPDGLAAIFATAAMPDRTQFAARAEQLDVLRRFYDVEGTVTALRRMHVATDSFRAPALSDAAVERLSLADAAALAALYAEYPESVFHAGALADRQFFGVRDGDRIVAAGGTHVVARGHGIAAVGSIFSLPEARRRGYATAITAAVTASLLALPCRDVFLNVAVENVTAGRIYERLGYRDHCLFYSGDAARRSG